MQNYKLKIKNFKQRRYDKSTQKTGCILVSFYFFTV